jgi:sugar-specific transcriptional regulator TrmB
VLTSGGMEEKVIEELKEFGLTEGEAKVYLALLAGESTRSGIVRKSGVSPSILYEILKKLQRKGLVSSVEFEGKKHFQPVSPEIFLQELEEKKAKVEKLVSILKTRKKENIVFARVYEGFKGLKGMLKDIEDEEFKKSKTKEWLAMGVTAYKKESFNRFWAYWHTTIRPKYKVKARFIFSEKGTNYFKIIKKAPLAKVKVISLPISVCITVCGRTTLIMKYTDLPTFLLVKNEEVAKTFREIFNFLWETKK